MPRTCKVRGISAPKSMSQIILDTEGQVVISNKTNGLGVITKLNAQTTGGSVAIVEHPLAPHALAAPLHLHHNEDEVSYILEGEVTVMLGDEVSVALAGTWVFKPRNQWHTFWNATDKPARILEIIAPGAFENYFVELAALLQSGGPPDPAARARLASKYNLEMDVASIPRLLEKYHLFLGAPPPAN